MPNSQLTSTIQDNRLPACLGATPATDRGWPTTSLGGGGATVIDVDPVHHIYLLDVSLSMSTLCEPESSRLQTAQDALIAATGVVARSEPNSQVTIVTFNQNATTLFQAQTLSSAYTQLVGAVRTTKPDGNTKISAALDHAESLITKPARTQLVLMTDGHGGNAVPAAERLKASGVQIGTIGFARTPDEVDEAMLQRCASNVDGRVLYEFANNRRSLSSSFVNMSRTRVR